VLISRTHLQDPRLEAGGHRHRRLSTFKPKAYGCLDSRCCPERARRYAEDHGMDLKDCFEAWIPEPQPGQPPRRPGCGPYDRSRLHHRAGDDKTNPSRASSGRGSRRRHGSNDLGETAHRGRGRVGLGAWSPCPSHTRCWWRFERVGELRNEGASGVLFGLQSGRASLPVLFGGKMLPGVGN
jgi:hypothetical protein